MHTSIPKFRRWHANRGRGIVLPVVLVMLVLMTVVVLFLTRRGAVDEILASNVRSVVTMETAAQYALRWCELWLWVSPPGIAPAAGIPNPPRVMGAPVSTAANAWRDASNWPLLSGGSLDPLGGSNDQSIVLPANVLGAAANVTNARCLIEDARGELDASEFTSGQAGLEFADTRRKYRLTSEVEGAGPSGLRFARSQSEVRMNLN